MKVLVIGATGGSGLAVTRTLLARGCEVTAFARQPHALRGLPGKLQLVEGDATCSADVDRAVQGHDAVVVALGIRENALRVRLLGSAGTAMDVRSQGTQHVLDAMRRHGVRRLVVQSSYGVGTTRDKLPWLYRLVFALLLKPQIADTERQEAIVRASGLDWVIAQPVNLTDDATTTPAHASPSGEVEGMKVSRRQVGDFLADAALNREHQQACVALSARNQNATAPHGALR
jgi:nucleoside-diphosphate-sugar epimerase